MIAPVIYYTDALIYLLGLIALFSLFFAKRSVLLKRVGQKILSQSRYVVTIVILVFFILVGFLDTVHFKKEAENTGSHRIVSLLDILLSPLPSRNEMTYSAPFATHSYVPELIKTETGKIAEIYPELEFAGQHLKDPKQDKALDIFQRLGKGLLLGIILTLALLLLFNVRSVFRGLKGLAKPKPVAIETTTKSVITHGKNNRSIVFAFWATLGLLICLLCISAFLMFDYHILGTDKVGRDVFYISIKSIRTGLIIGSLTTLIMLPFALFFGMLAGYFPGIIDDAIQYVYITLSSIPAVLLIAAAVVSLQIKIEANPDLKLLLLCIILGLTTWTSLCRYVRGETLKLRDSEFVQAAITLGANKANILWRHILPNLMHIVVITIVLDFSGLVLAEGVLTYMGVGVDPATYSWGSMINASRLEMGRDPIVWWSLMGAFVLMFALVFSANIFSEAIQEALSPRRE